MPPLFGPHSAAVALLQIGRPEVLLGSQFYRQTVQQFGMQLDLNYTIFDFAAYLGFLEQLARRYRRQGAILIQDNASY